jgi:hypothetical protein
MHPRRGGVTPPMIHTFSPRWLQMPEVLIRPLHSVPLSDLSYETKGTGRRYVCLLLGLWPLAIYYWP